MVRKTHKHTRTHSHAHGHTSEPWYADKQNIALVLGFVSTIITLLNTIVD